MRRILMTIPLIFVIFACGKQYTCSCYDANGNHTQDHVHRYWSKSEAKESCKSFEVSYNTPDGHCELEDE